MNLGPRPSGLPRRIPSWAWAALRLPSRFLPHKKPSWFWVWRSWRLGLLRPQIVMYDDVSLALIPPDAQAVAGYVDGKWKTFLDVQARWPKAHHLSIAVSAGDDADCLDIEPGNASISQAAVWIQRQHRRGVRRPVVYTSVSWAPKLMKTLAAAGVPRSQYRLWTAHYNYKSHRCSRSCWTGFSGRADATQWTNKALDRSLDESLCAPDFFDS